jgi:hypothetical protein
VGSVFGPAKLEAKEHFAAEVKTEEEMLASHVELKAQPMRSSLASVSQPVSWMCIRYGHEDLDGDGIQW